MKTYLLAGLLTLSLTLTVNAQMDDSFKQETVQFIKLTGAANNFQNAVDQIGMMVPETKKAEYVKEANATLDDLYGQLAEIYMKEFTRDDIKQLVAFYDTDLGKKLAANQMKMAQEGMMLAQSWMSKVQAIAQKYEQ